MPKSIPFAPAHYAVYSNALPGKEEALEAWYEDVHIPDSLDEGLFDSVRRYRAVDPAGASFLTLWGCPYGSEDEALAAVRPVAEKLRARGRIEVVQEVVFQQFVFLEDARVPRGTEVLPGLTTLHSCWSQPGSVAEFDAWFARETEADRLEAKASARYGVPDPRRKALVLLEDTTDSVATGTVQTGGEVAAGLPPFGSPTPIFEGGSPAPGPAELDSEEVARLEGAGRAWALRWQLISSR